MKLKFKIKEKYSRRNIIRNVRQNGRKYITETLIFISFFVPTLIIVWALLIPTYWYNVALSALMASALSKLLPKSKFITKRREKKK